MAHLILCIHHHHRVLSSTALQYTTMQWDTSILYWFFLWYVMITLIISYLLFQCPLSKPIYFQRAQFYWVNWVCLFVTCRSNLELFWTCNVGKSRKPVGTEDRLDPATTLLVLLPLLLHSSLPIFLYHFVSSRHVVVVSASLSLCTVYGHFHLLLHHFSFFMAFLHFLILGGSEKWWWH